MTGSPYPAHFPTFRPSRGRPAPPAIPPTPSFGLFLPTPLPASNAAALSPYFHSTDLPALPLPPARPVSLVPQPRGLQPRYQLHEPIVPVEGTIGESGCFTPIPPIPIPRITKERPLPHPVGDDRGTAPPRHLPPPPHSLHRQDERTPPRQEYASTIRHQRPGQVLVTSSTAYCEQMNGMPLQDGARVMQSRVTPLRPTGPRSNTSTPKPLPLPIGQSKNRPWSETLMRRDRSSVSSSSRSDSDNATDLKRRSALKSLPPARDYSSSTNQSYRTSLLAQVTQPSPILSSELTDSPPAEFIDDNPAITLSWQPEPDSGDAARNVWRKMEQRMGVRCNSQLQERGRWVVTPSTPTGRGGVEMSPGQFTISDYMTFGEEDGSDTFCPPLMEKSKVVPNTPHPQADIHRSHRTKSRRSTRTTDTHSVLDTLDASLFPLDPLPADTGLTILRQKTQKRQRNSMCRLDTQIVSALEALKTDWASPDLDMALSLGNERTTSPDTPVVSRKVLSPSRPLPALTKRSVSPPDPQITTPPTQRRALPTPLTPSERGLGLGVPIGRKSTYGLPPRYTDPPRTSRPLPSPQAVSLTPKRGLSRKSTIKVEKVPRAEGVFIIRDLDTGEACEVDIEGLEAALSEMARKA